MNQKDLDVVVVGELNADLILSGDVTPAFGQVEKLVEDARLSIGSSAAIFACGAARLGLRVAFAGLMGDDTFGRFMLASLQSAGVDTSSIRVDATLRTGLSVILNRVVDRAILTFPGAIPQFSLRDIDPALFDRARHLHLASYFLLDGLRPDVPRLFADARRKGMTVSLDTNYDPRESWSGMHELLPLVDIFMPNETELLAISGAADVEDGINRLSTQGPLVIVKQGAAGASARQGSRLFRSASIPVQVVDTVGAGDSFDAGFIYGYLQDRERWPLERVLRLACVCGALSTRQAGGTQAQPTLPEAELAISRFA